MTYREKADIHLQDALLSIGLARSELSVPAGDIWNVQSHIHRAMLNLAESYTELHELSMEALADVTARFGGR